MSEQSNVAYFEGVPILEDDSELAELVDAQLNLTDDEQSRTRTNSGSMQRSKSQNFKKSTSIGFYHDFKSIEKDFNDYKKLFDGNMSFVETKLKNDPNYFVRLSKSQSPKYVLIGCADSRVPPDQLTQTEPGEIFIHRNGTYTRVIHVLMFDSCQFGCKYRLECHVCYTICSRSAQSQARNCNGSLWLWWSKSKHGT
jgi:hypothetical protein